MERDYLLFLSDLCKVYAVDDIVIEEIHQKYHLDKNNSIFLIDNNNIQTKDVKITLESFELFKPVLMNYFCDKSLLKIKSELLNESIKTESIKMNKKLGKASPSILEIINDKISDFESKPMNEKDKKIISDIKKKLKKGNS